MLAKSNDSMRNRKIIKQFVGKICFYIVIVNLVIM